VVHATSQSNSIHIEPLTDSNGEETDQATYFTSCNRNKRSVTIDMAALEVVNTYEDEGTHDVHALILGRMITGVAAFASRAGNTSGTQSANEHHVLSRIGKGWTFYVSRATTGMA